MEREFLENEDIARLLNEHFVSIKSTARSDRTWIRFT